MSAEIMILGLCFILPHWDDFFVWWIHCGIFHSEYIPPPLKKNKKGKKKRRKGRETVLIWYTLKTEGTVKEQGWVAVVVIKEMGYSVLDYQVDMCLVRVQIVWQQDFCVFRCVGCV